MNVICVNTTSVVSSLILYDDVCIRELMKVYLKGESVTCMIVL
jgi:hypothetical protein